MSTKTNFKRIALAAVAALGLGLLNSVPSQAAVTSLTVTATNASAGTTKSDSTTAASVAVTALFDAAWDTVSVQLVPRSGTTQKAYLVLGDTSVVNTLVKYHASCTLTDTPTRSGTISLKNSATDSVTSTSACFQMNYDTQGATATTGYVGASFRLFLESTPATTFTVGTYGYTVVVKAYDGGAAANTAKTIARDVDYVVARSATETNNASKVVNAGNSWVTMGDSTANMTSGISASTADSSIAVASTAATTTHAVLRVFLRNAANTTSAQESITATITAGRIGISGSIGRDVTLAYTSTDVTAGYKDLIVEADGTAGVATATVKTTSATFPAKSITFYSTTAAKVTAASYSSVIGASGIGVMGNEFDAKDNNFGAGTDIYAFSSDTSVISSFGTACTWNATAKAALCTLTGVKNGTANITLRDASTVAASTVSSSAVPVRVNLNSAASVELKWNKATYAPGEKATLLVTVKDSAGTVMPAGTYANLFATGGLTSSASLTSASSTTLSSVSVVTMVNLAASSDTPVVTTDPIGQISVFMPMAGGTVEVTGKGGTSLAAAGQVALSAKASITDNGAAALAAVNALATTVASLRTLITTLTNLVLKIQKKVKA